MDKKTISAMDRVTRTGVSLPADLLREFDEFIKAKGYKNRSKAICDAIRRFVSECRWEIAEGKVVGVISFVYDRGTRDVSDALIELEHRYANSILSTMHIHLTEDRCLEVVVAKGAAEDVRGLAGLLMSRRGVLHLKLMPFELCL